MKNVFQNKKYSEKCDIVLHFVTLFNVLLNRRQLDFHNCFYIQSLVICCLFEIYEENPAIYRYVLEKG